MFLSCWLTSVRNLFASRRGRGSRRPVARRGLRGAAGHHAQRSVEQLEARQVLAFDFVSAYPNSGAFLTEGAIVDQSPQQITIKFSPGAKVDPQSIATGISVIRSANGVLGDSGDIVVTPGSITVDDFPNQNVVIVRFAETLPDDNYRLLITGAGPGGLRTLSQGTGIPSERFRAGGSFQLDFRLDLGAQVASIVPQPVARPKLMTFATDMTQYKDGDLLSVAIRGSRLTFEFDGNASVAAGNRAVSIVGRTAAEITAEIALAITSSGVFGGELLSATTPQATRINLRGTTFTPVVSFTRGGSVPAATATPVTIADGAALTQARDKVAVYFNVNDPLDPASAQNPRNYRLIETDPVTKTDVAVQVPQAVSYDAASGTALLTFEAGGIADDKLYRLRVGDSSDDNNLLAKATPLGALFTGNPYRTDAVIGDGAEGMNDVDLYQASLTAAGSISATLTTPVGSTLVGVLRLFDSAGNEVARSATGTLVHAAAAPGIFYLGVSSTGNDAYLPATGTGATGGASRGAYRIQITSDVAVAASDENSSFGAATALGTLGLAGQTVSGQIDVRPTIATPAGPLLFPSQPGTIDEPGHREIPVEGESHLESTSSVGPAAAMPVRFYNFRDDYGLGVDPQGNPVHNAITEEQKQRAREIFTLFSIHAGIRFVESADQGMFVATGDLRALNPNMPPNSAAGLGGPRGVVMNSTIDWGNSEYGGAWFTTAMHEIGHAIGLDHAYDIPAVMGAGETGAQQLGENLLPLPYDVVHMNVLYPRNGSDIDVYRFALDTAGTFSAETIVARQGQAAASALDTVLSLYREVGGVRTLVARNDDYYGTDSFVGLELEAGTYFLAVTSTGNTAFNPEVSDSGYGGRTDGAYQLRLDFKPAAGVAGTIVDATGTPFDGDRDGKAGGAFDSWFTTASATATLWVDKVAAAVGSVTNGSTLVTGISTVGLVVGRAVIGAGIQANTVVQSIRDATSFFLSRPATATSAAAALGLGTFAAPYRTISAAISAANAAINAGTNVPRVIRILGNSGNDATTLDEKPYLIGTTLGGTALADGATFNVPKGVTAMIDATAAIKLRAAVIDVGSSSGLVSRAGAAIQVLGTPGRHVIFTSFHDDSVGGDSDGVGPAVQGGQWGGIVLRQDSDSPRGAASTVPHDPWVNKPWLNTISFATMRYGGGNVMVDSKLQSFAPIHLESNRPTIAFNEILSSAGAGISADPNSFEDSGGRFGPELRGNRLLDNTINGLFIRIRTEFGAAIDKLDRPARFKSTDITYVIQENLVIAGGAGGYLLDETSGDVVARATGRLVIDPGVVVKLMGARIELERGNAQLVAEGTALQRVILTSLGDRRFGAGGTFDTNGNAPDVRAPGDWSGLVAQAGAEVSIDNAYIAYGGGQSAIEGGFDRFDTIEVQQAMLRLANSRIEFNASGRSSTQRNARGSNDDSTVFVRQAQPVIVGNDFRDNSGATFSLNANSFSNTANPDPGRSTGAIARYAEYDDNVGPLLRANAISNKINYAADRQKGAFDITLQYGAGVTKAVRDAMEAAADRWESVITGDISPVLSGGRVIDDIFVRVQAGLLGGSPSDGAGGTLANAGPTAFRSDTDVNPFLPYEAQVGVDMSDATSGQLVAILTHELGHALGFLDVSDALGLTNGARYLGTAALAEYRSTFDAGATFVPLEAGGGAGTAFSHWDEATFGSELLTGFLNPGINPLTRLSVGAFQDMGYSVNYSAADDYLPKSGTVGYAQPTSGVVVRGEQILVDSVWDDTDLVHVVTSEITVDNFHTATGLRLESQSNASLVVKFAGPTAGFTATGTPGSIDDRIGGTVQVVGQPGYPVVLTSVFDDSVGASLDPLGRTVFDTNNDGRAWIDSTATAPITASWRSLKFLPLSNDTNVTFVREAELPYTNLVDVNQTPFDAQLVGILAPNFAVGGASTESAQHKGTDENRRDGFVVRGAIAVDNPGDVDVYSFGGYAGSEVWLDIDQTASSLDTMLELLDAGGTVLARSVDGQFDSQTVTGEVVAGAGAAATQTYALSSGRILPGSLGGSIYHGNTVVQTFTVDRSGAFTFTSVGAPARRVTGATLDRDTGVVTLVWNGAVTAGGTRIEADYAAAGLSLATLGFTASGANGALPLAKDDWRGNDYYTVNPRDAGMRVILPGTQGSLNLYFLRVRSQPKVDPSATLAEYEAAVVDPTKVNAGATSGAYELRVRLQQRDQVPGSTVVYADIRYATTGIDIQGLPRNSLLTGTTAQAGGGSNRELISAQNIGKLLQSDQNMISVAGRVDSATDVRWFKFTADYANDIQAIPGVNGGGKTWATVLDIDYASGFRGDLSLAVFNEDGTLIFLGRDSDVAADQPAPGQGNDFDDLSRGSAGKLDPFIGTVQLPVGATADNPTDYYVAIMSNATLPEVLDGTFRSGSTNAQVRLEPVNSVERIVEDHLGFTGYASNGATVAPKHGPLFNVVEPDAGASIALSANVRPFNLGDVTLYVSTGSSVFAADALRGKKTYDLAGYESGVGDIDMRTDGKLFQVLGRQGDVGNVGFLREISTADGAVVSEVGDAVPNMPDSPADTDFWKLTSDTVEALAIARTDVATYENSVFYSLRRGTSSLLYWGRTDGNAAFADGEPYSLRGTITGAGVTGRTTGLQFRGENGTLYGVSTGGQFYSVSIGSGAATLVADFSAELAAIGDGTTGFQGLATAPVNLDGGRYQGMFFAITNTGRLVCIAPNLAGTSATLLQNVFDNDADGVPEATISSALGAGVTGLAFSPLDVNLWHPTTTRTGDVGHGINAAPDNSRQAVAGGTSLYFGLEELPDPSADNAFWRFNPGGANGQFGMATFANYNWQADLTRNAAIGGNYDVPGGAHGSLVSNAFSLAGYAATDKPTLYFNYFLDTEGASGSGMRDSARALISVDDGLTWELLATNNSARSSLSQEDAELPNTATASSAVGTASNQAVQELFDSSDAWRQARIDLANWVGASNIRLRFDFATAGKMDPTALRTTADETKRVTAGSTTAQVTLASVSGLREGMVVTGQGITGQPTVVSIDSGTRVTLSSAVTVASGDTLSFFDTENRTLNDIDGLANAQGDLGVGRGQNNAFEGFYVDDLVVGFAERGEMVTGAGTKLTSTFSVATPTAKIYPPQSLQGEYQLEIRRGTEHAVQMVPSKADITIAGTLDTNDGLVQAPSAPAKVLEENLVDAVDGTVLARSGNGRLRFMPSTPAEELLFLQAGIDIPAGDFVAVLDSSSTTAQTANLLAWNVDLAGQASAVLEFTYLTLPAQESQPLPPAFQTPVVGGTKVIPSGNGVAISVDGGTSWTTLAGLGNTQGQLSTVRLDLGRAAEDAGLTLSATTVIGFFQAGKTRLDIGPTLNPLLAGGIMLDDFRITADPPRFNLGTIGDQNHPRTQGQFVVANNIISHTAGYGISITAGARDGQFGDPNPGSPRNLPVLNNAGLVPGAVVMNNVIADSGKAGILFAGDPGTLGAAAGPVPFGRIVNNTIWGGEAAARGIEVRDNAAPTILNNLFADLSAGVTVDGSSAQGQRTVVGTSAYWQVGQQVSGVTESSPIVLSGNPFVNAAGGNFYLVDRSEAIDSSINSLQDRAEYTVVKTPLGIQPSPIVAPDRDLYGQLRGDDPGQASAPGLGSNVFKDRGAIDRVDFAQPRIAIIDPVDGRVDAPVDRDDEVDAIRLERDQATGALQFVLQIGDEGVGIDKSSVSSAAFRLSVDTGDGVVRLLQPGVDYMFRYLQNSNRVIFESISAFPLGTYTIEALTLASTPVQTGMLVDLANNTLLPNKFDGTTSFQVALADIPSMALGLVGTRGDASVTLAWQPPASIGGTPIIDYLVQFSSDGGTTWTTFADGISGTTGAVVTGLTNGVSYVFRVQGRNAVNILSADLDDGHWSQTSLPVKPLAPAGRPTNLVANGGNASATLAWTAPTETGGAPITDYRVQYSTNGGTTWTTFPHAPSTATTITVTGLANGVSHVFRVAAITEYGPGLSSDVSIVVVPMTFPDAPTGLTAKLGNTLVDLTWTSNFNGGSTVVNHVVQFRVTGSATWQTFTPPAPVTGSSVRVTGLVNGTSYEFRVAATNAVGDSGFSNVAGPVTPVAPASPPLALVAEGGNAQAKLSWTVPANDGGSAITDYRIERSTNGGTTWTLVADAVSTATTATLLGLVNGTTYVFRVAAITSYGVGAWSTTSASVTPMTVATAPSGLAGVRGDSKVDLTWTAPADNGGATITDYTIEFRPSAGGAWVAFPHAASAATTASVTGLVNGSSYEFRVSAVNAAGTSAPSNVAGALVPMTFASAPLNLVGAFGDRKVTLTWATPTSNGGGAISDYLVEYLAAGPGAVWTTFPHDPSTATRIVVTELVNGIGYTFRVSAVNPVGAGTAATVGPITPMTIPGAPAIVTATPGDSKVDLVWRAPTSNGGGAITNYIIEFKVDAAAAAWERYPRAASAALSATVGNLVNGTKYLFRVTAVNPAGAGPASLPSASVMPVTVPDAPLAVTAVGGDKQASLTWTKPARDGGLPITDYVVEYRRLKDAFWTVFADGVSTATTATVTGLLNGANYAFRVRAKSAFGESPSSAESNYITVRGLAGAPTGLVATAGDAVANLSWTAPADNGGGTITDYRIEYRKTTETAWTPFPHLASAATTATVTGLTTATSYVFRVAAVNVVGTGAFSVLSNVLAVVGSPSAPTGLTGTVDTKSVALSWNAPAKSNGAAITDYIVEYRKATDATWTVFEDGVGTATKATVSGLVNGVAYVFRVKARNSVGDSPVSAETAPLTPIGPADGPTNVAGIGSRGTVRLSWTPPADTGGLPITGYVVQYRLNKAGSAWVTATWPVGVSATATSITITGFRTRFGHVFRVAAKTSFGQGNWSAESAAVNPFGT